MPAFAGMTRGVNAPSRLRVFSPWRDRPQGRCGLVMTVEVRVALPTLRPLRLTPRYRAFSDRTAMPIAAPVAQPSSTRAAAVSYETALLWLGAGRLRALRFLARRAERRRHLVACGDGRLDLLRHRARSRASIRSRSPPQCAPWTAWMNGWRRCAVRARPSYRRLEGAVVLLTGAAAGAATFTSRGGWRAN